MKLKNRIQILVVFLMAIPLLLLLFESYRVGRTVLLEQIRKDAIHTAMLQRAELEQVFENPRLAAEALVRSLEGREDLEGSDLEPLLRRTLEQTPEAFGLTIAQLGSEPKALYVHRAGAELRCRELKHPQYNFQAFPWFTRPLSKKSSLWSEPYFDQGGGNIPMTTFSALIWRGKSISGLVAVDVSLEGLIDRLSQLKPGGDGQAYLVNPKGALIAHPKFRPVEQERTTDSETLCSSVRPLLDRSGLDSLATRDPFTGESVWLVETPLESLKASHGGQDWSLIVSWPSATRVRPLFDLGKRLLILYLALGGAAVLFLNRSLHDLITRPIWRLSKQAKAFAERDFRDLGQVHEDSQEFSELGQSIQALGNSLKQTAAKDQP